MNICVYTYITWKELSSNRALSQKRLYMYTHILRISVYTYSKGCVITGLFLRDENRALSQKTQYMCIHIYIMYMRIHIICRRGSVSTGLFLRD